MKNLSIWAFILSLVLGFFIEAWAGVRRDRKHRARGACYYFLGNASQQHVI